MIPHRHETPRPASPSMPPALGDWSTRRLTAHLMIAWRDGRLPMTCRVRGVTVELLRRELVRRETVGMTL
jgi:hypothetical protein